MTDAGEVQHIKRPMNAFMVWSSPKRKDLARENPTLHNSQISKILGVQWRQLAEDEKRRCFAQAKLLNELHMIQYPDYKYRPKRRAKKRKLVKDNGVFPRYVCPQLSRVRLDCSAVKESDDQETSSSGNYNSDVNQQTTAAVVTVEDGTEDSQQLPERETLFKKKEKSCLGKVENWPQSSAFEKRGNHNERSFQGVHDGLAGHYHPMGCLTRPPEDLRGAAQGRVSREMSTNYIGQLHQVPHGYVSMDAMLRYRRTMEWQFLA